MMDVGTRVDLGTMMEQPIEGALKGAAPHTNGGANDRSVPERSTDEFADLALQLDNLLEQVRSYRKRFAAEIKEAHSGLQESAENLVDYLAIRQFDLRNLQESLAQWGLSSLGRTEAHVTETIQAVAGVLHQLAGDRQDALRPIDFVRSRSHIEEHALALFGQRPDGRGVRIMVTLPSEAADDYRSVRDLIAAGTDVVRINCAHDDEATWRRMVDHVRYAQAETDRHCRILMDLAGAKLRTGSLEPGPEVLKAKPQRDKLGQVTAPARVWLAPEGLRPPADIPVDIAPPVAVDWLDGVRLGDDIRLKDARSKKRSLKVVERWGAGVVAEITETAYLITGTELKLKPGDGRKVAKSTTEVGRLPAVEIPLVLRRGETLILHAADVPGTPGVRAHDGKPASPARIACTLPDVFPSLRVGEPVKFNDGKIEGRIKAVSSDEIEIEITLAAAEGTKLRADKGINFPESDLNSRALTPKDLKDLDFIVRHADVVGLSFAENVETLTMLQKELAERRAADIGVVLKIETQRGFRRLPALLLAAMKSYPVGVMIARGDLAVECGWERTAEVQEEILWLCEAAHVPVVWATQVLEGMTKKGIPSRAEITDAAMAERAECVMLNKGPYIVRAIHMLDDVLKRMAGHQTKKTALLRSLTISDLLEKGAGR